MIFNPSFPYRLRTSSTPSTSPPASWWWAWPLSCCAAGGSRRRAPDALGDALDAAVLVPLQIYLGDSHGLNTREYQPAKLAAIEARWATEAAPLNLFAIPDQGERRIITRFDALSG